MTGKRSKIGDTSNCPELNTLNNIVEKNKLSSPSNEKAVLEKAEKEDKKEKKSHFSRTPKKTEKEEEKKEEKKPNHSRLYKGKC